MKTATLTNACLVFAILFTISSCDLQNYRLPKNIKPVRYYLLIQPNFEKETFNGSVVIDIIALENSNYITLHKKRLEINCTSIGVLSTDGEEIEVVNTTEDEIHQTYTINTKNQLIKDTKYRLVIESFNGILDQKLDGFCISSYNDTEGHERKFALTNFQPLDARAAFPCFDEPALKAKFIINLIRQSEYKSASNVELESTVHLGNDLYQDIYKETPEMSTYFVAFAVFDFDYVNSSNTSKIYGRPEKIKDNSFLYAVEDSEIILQAMENFTGIRYGLNKLDQIAVPDSVFISKTKESWGLVTHRELTLDFSNSSPPAEIEQKLSIVAHEISQQWFGNLVTPLWWDSVWLSKAFAAYFQHYLVNAVHPSWRSSEQLVSTLHMAFRTDSKSTPKNITLGQNYLEYGIGRNSIFYDKGAVVVRMMEHFLTHDIFRNGLRIYLNRHKFDSAQTRDMYDALQTAVNDANANHLLGNLTVAEILDAWINRSGFPIVTVTRNYTSGTTTFSQKKRDIDGAEYDEPQLYHVPINYVFQSDPPEKMLKTNADFWLSDNNKTLYDLTGSGWILVNIQQTGFYRVNYDIQNWERIIDFMRYGNFEEIPPANRAQLINDAFNLAKSKAIPYTIAFKLCEYLVRERDYLPILTFLVLEPLISESFKNLKQNEINEFWNYTITKRKPEDLIGQDVIEAYFVHIFEPAYNYFGVIEKENDSHLDKTLRYMLVSDICPRLKDCREDLKTEFTKLKTYGINAIKPTMQYTVMCEGARSESGKDYLQQLYKQTKSITQRNNIEFALRFCHKQIR